MGFKFHALFLLELNEGEGLDSRVTTGEEALNTPIQEQAPTVGQDVSENTQSSCACQKSDHNSPAEQSVALSLY